MYRTRACRVAALLASLAVLVACAPGAAEKRSPDDLLRVTTEVPSTFDPALAASLPDWILARAGYDTLVRFDQQGLAPGIAESWTSTLTGATFVLRKDATCADGTPITADVVKASLDRYASAGGPTVASVLGIQPAPPTITADDAARTVHIKLRAPWPVLVRGLSTASTGIVCPAGLHDLHGLAAGTVPAAASGPYTLTTAEHGVKYTYALRTTYAAWPKWRAPIAGRAPKTLQFVVTTDTTTAANLLLNGQLDIGKVEAEGAARFRGNDAFTVETVPFSDYYLIFNERRSSPFTDPALRRAVAEAINRAAFGQVASNGYGRVATSLFAPEAECGSSHGPDATIPYNPAAAAHTLAGVHIRIVAPNLIGTTGSGNVFVQEALRAAGANVELDNTNVGTWISTVFTKPETWDLTINAGLNFTGTPVSPLTNFMGPAVSDGGGNFGATQSPEAAASFTKALATPDEHTRCDLLIRATNALIAGAHTVPLAHQGWIYVQRRGAHATLLNVSIDDHLFRITE